MVFDKGRSARAAALAVGGRWHPLQPGGAFTLQPLSRIEDDGERAWASEWLADAVRLAGLAPTPRIREEIWEALGALAQAPVAQRTLTVFTALVQDKAVAAALEPFTLKGPHGALIDGVAPGDETLAAFECFELERLMATPSAVAPVLAALFHDIERGFDGRLRGAMAASEAAEGDPRRWAQVEPPDDPRPSRPSSSPTPAAP